LNLFSTPGFFSPFFPDIRSPPVNCSPSFSHFLPLFLSTVQPRRVVPLLKPFCTYRPLFAPSRLPAFSSCLTPFLFAHACNMVPILLEGYSSLPVQTEALLLRFACPSKFMFLGHFLGERPHLSLFILYSLICCFYLPHFEIFRVRLCQFGTTFLAGQVSRAESTPSLMCVKFQAGIGSIVPLHCPSSYPLICRASSPRPLRRFFIPQSSFLCGDSALSAAARFPEIVALPPIFFCRSLFLLLPFCFPPDFAFHFRELPDAALPLRQFPSSFSTSNQFPFPQTGSVFFNLSWGTLSFPLDSLVPSPTPQSFYPLSWHDACDDHAPLRTPPPPSFCVWSHQYSRRVFLRLFRCRSPDVESPPHRSLDSFSRLLALSRIASPPLL